jgi:hypothetical protein
MTMSEGTRQRLWRGAVLILGVIAIVQTLNNRDLRDELERTRISPEELQRQVDERAKAFVVDSVRSLRQEMIAAGQWLHAYYQSEEGLKRPQGLWLDDRPDFEGIGAWLFDVYLTQRLAGADDATAKKVITDAIQQSDEWRQKHPGAR